MSLPQQTMKIARKILSSRAIFGEKYLECDSAKPGIHVPPHGVLALKPEDMPVNSATLQTL